MMNDEVEQLMILY